MIHRLFPLRALAAWTGLALGARAWPEPLPYPKPDRGQCARATTRAEGSARPSRRMHGERLPRVRASARADGCAARLRASE